MRAKGLALIGLIAILTLLVGLAIPWAKQEGKGNGKKSYLPGEIPMTATFWERTGDRITSDNESPYVDGEEGVRAVLVSARNFVLDTRRSDRYFFLNFGSGACDGVLPFRETVVPVNFFSTSGLIDDDGNLVEDRLLGMHTGEKFKSGAQVFFTVDSDPDFQYFLRFDPDFVGVETGARSYVWITREFNNQWTIEAGSDAKCDPSDDNNDCGLALLLKRTLRGKPRMEFVGLCRMPFELTVYCQDPADCPVPE